MALKCVQKWKATIFSNVLHVAVLDFIAIIINGMGFHILPTIFKDLKSSLQRKSIHSIITLQKQIQVYVES